MSRAKKCERATQSAQTLEPLLTDEQVAAIYNVHPHTPKNWRCKSTPKKRIGPPWVVVEIGGKRGLIRYRAADVAASIKDAA